MPVGHDHHGHESSAPDAVRRRLLSGIWHAVDRWDSDPEQWITSFLRDPETAAAMAELDDVPQRTLGLIAREIAHLTAFDIAYRLADPDFVDAPTPSPEHLPGWSLVATTPDGSPTDDSIDDLHEDLGDTWEEVTDLLGFQSRDA